MLLPKRQFLRWPLERKGSTPVEPDPEEEKEDEPTNLPQVIQIIKSGPSAVLPKKSLRLSTTKNPSKTQIVLLENLFRRYASPTR
jgi:hypothetical protein